jgi:RHS repeat-associated protein
LYSGEQFDSKIGQQYLRARYYDPATGRFNRLDPFFGNQAEPQSLHKYLYTHGDPVNAVDPSGKNAVMAAFTMILGGAIGGRVIGNMVDTPLGALTAGLIGGAFIGNPFIGLGFLLGLYFSPWNNKKNYEWSKFWTLMNGAEAMYDAGDHSMITENIDKRPSEMFYDFRWGNGKYHPRNYYFGICPMTLAMRKQPAIIEEKEIIKTVLSKSINNNYIPTFSEIKGANEAWYSANINDIFTDMYYGFIDSVGSYLPFRGSDEYEARVLKSFLGSYTYNWEIKSVVWEEGQRQATVRFRAGNAAGLRSLTRIPIGELTGIHCDEVSILGDQHSGWYAVTTQFFMWEEVINF